MTKKQIHADFLLLLTAIIWGFAFTAQSVGARYLGGLTFNGIRFALGSLSLVPLILIFDRDKRQSQKKDANLSFMLWGGLVAGIVLFFGANLQQFGIAYTTAGNAGFITGLYIVLIPLFNLFMKKPVPVFIWIGVVLAVCGLYLLSIKSGFSINFGDVLMLIGAVFWAVHILLIDYLVRKISALKLACLQFAVCSLLCLVGAVFTETVTLEALKGALVPLLYGGLCSVGIAYTLQIVAQKDAPPTQAAMILSMETVFSAVGGALILGEFLNARGYVGCALILCAIILSQIQPKK